MTRARWAAASAVVLLLAGVAVVRIWQPFATEPFVSLPPPSLDPKVAPLPAAPAVADLPPVVSPVLPPASAPDAAAPRVPFSVGERALYEVSWLGLGAGLPAGTAEFAVHDGGRAGRYRFELLAVTANWVSAFFEARDRFWTVTTPDLLPVVHGQELREGRRHVERVARFERDTHLVRIGNGTADQPAAGVSRAWSPDARDPLGAMYYVRTLVWEPDTSRRLLVSDLGMELAVDVRSGRPEQVRAEGRLQAARRLTVRMEYVTERYKTPKATVWLSADTRRIPLTAEVETEVGVFRMALVRFTAGETRPAAPPR